MKNYYGDISLFILLILEMFLIYKTVHGQSLILVPKYIEDTNNPICYANGKQIDCQLYNNYPLKSGQTASSLNPLILNSLKDYEYYLDYVDQASTSVYMIKYPNQLPTDSSAI